MKVLRKQEIDTANIQVGDQMVIPLAELGEFTATAHKVTDEGVMFIFDDYVTRRPMNNRNTNKGGFEKSDLKSGWIRFCIWRSRRNCVTRFTDLHYPLLVRL